MSQVSRISEHAPDHRGRITQGYISRLESGKETNPSLMKLMTLCSIYNVEPNELLVKSSRKKSKEKVIAPSRRNASGRSSDAAHGRPCNAV